VNPGIILTTETTQKASRRSSRASPQSSHPNLIKKANEVIEVQKKSFPKRKRYLSMLVSQHRKTCDELEELSES
jgi:hypothetical protein